MTATLTTFAIESRTKATQVESAKVSQNHGGIPIPPGRIVQAESGVEGLPTPASSFVHQGSAGFVSRESATLSELAAARRTSHTHTLAIAEEESITQVVGFSNLNHVSSFLSFALSIFTDLV